MRHGNPRHLQLRLAGEPFSFEGRHYRNGLVQASQVHKDTYAALGALPTPVAFPELYSALQTRVERRFARAYVR